MSGLKQDWFGVMFALMGLGIAGLDLNGHAMHSSADIR